jgi:hypothetical protein
MSMERHNEMISTGETPDWSTRPLWQSYQKRHLVVNQEELDKINYEFGLRNSFVSYFKVTFT